MTFAPRVAADTDPGTWSGLALTAATIFLEGEGEPDEGRVAIAWVIRNRANRQPPTQDVAHVVILGPDRLADDDGKPWEAFSCFNDDYRAQRVKRLMYPAADVWEQCWRAAAGAWWRLLPDPTAAIGGASHYLNIELTRTIRGGTLPAWAELALATDRFITIGRHTFLRP